MSKTFGAALLLASALAIAAGPAQALQLVVRQIDKNANGTSTYHFAVKTDPGETLAPGADFVTVYNFAGLVPGSTESPAGWAFSSKVFGQTPTWNGYAAVLPVDMPGLHNLTWTAKKAVAGGQEVEGFSATTRTGATTQGEYSAQVTQQAGGKSKSSKLALIGQIPTPGYLTTK